LTYQQITLLLLKGKYMLLNRFSESLVGSEVIGAELGREDYGSSPSNCDREEAGTG
jgi:hypothetical protein